jgi:uncharacterized membrane-anchored protein
MANIHMPSWTESVKQIAAAVAIVLATSVVLAWLASVIDRPAGQNFGQRLLQFVLVCTILFVGISLRYSKANTQKRK